MSKSDSRRTRPDEVEHLLRNAQLRDELEPYFDESISQLNVRELPTPVENEYLASMLAWERAPVLPIAEWFVPPLVLPPPETLDDRRLQEVLWDTIYRLYEQRVVLDFTDHLSDRQLYCLILRDILPSPEKKLARGDNFLHWGCVDASDDPEVWLRYYATPEEREGWLETEHLSLPAAETPPYLRNLPRAPF